jgi:hypothetical protein
VENREAVTLACGTSDANQKPRQRRCEGALMSVYPRERSSEHDKLADVTDEIEDFVRQQRSDADGQTVTNDLVSLLARAARSSTLEIDQVMAELQLLRERVEDDGARVRRNLVEYATLAQSTLETTKVISESLRHTFPKRSA